MSVKPNSLEGKLAVVTGAASGIGRELALALASEKCDLVLVDIDAGGLEETCSRVQAMGRDCRTFITDVSRYQDVKVMADRVIADFGGIDILANVAGVCVFADVVDTPIEDWERLMGVNLWGPVHTIHCFLPSMIERRRGHILNVSSGGGLFGLIGLGAYCTTKFGLVGLSEVLEQELRNQGVGVTVVCPGGVNTEILDNIRFYGYSRERLVRFVRSVIKHGMSGEQLAELTVRAVKRNTFLVAPSVFVRFHYYVKRISPYLFRQVVRPGRKLLRTFFR